MRGISPQGSCVEVVETGVQFCGYLFKAIFISTPILISSNILVQVRDCPRVGRHAEGRRQGPRPKAAYILVGDST